MAGGRRCWPVALVVGGGPLAASGRCWRLVGAACGWWAHRRALLERRRLLVIGATSDLHLGLGREVLARAHGQAVCQHRRDADDQRECRRGSSRSRDGCEQRKRREDAVHTAEHDAAHVALERVH